MPGRVPWERYGGDEIEAVISMMLLRQHPRGQRIRPSRGDGGIDVLVPHSANRWEIFQIKKFTTKRDSSQERQITKSWNRLVAYVAEKRIRVTAWHVVRPIDPTREDREWLAKLTEDAEFAADWIGLTTVDNWVADYPQVIDYYFNNGQEYVLDTARTLVQALGVSGPAEPSAVLQPDAALTSIRRIVAALNKTDPHYSYRLSAELAPGDNRPVITPAPGSVFSAVVVEDDTMSQLDIIARYAEAPLDRPLPADLQVTVAPDSDDVRQQMRDFFAYGLPFRGVPASVTTADLPGGFTLAEMQSVSVSVLDEAQPKPCELRAIDENDHTIATLPLSMTRPTEGSEGIAWAGDDRSGVIGLSFRINPTTRSVGLGVTLRDISGADPAYATDALTAVQKLRAGCRIQVGIPGGPSVLSLDSLPGDLIGTDDEDDYITRLAICMALRVLQAKIPQHISVPDMSTVEQKQVVDWIHAATLLDGHQVVWTWSGLAVTYDDEVPPLALPCWVRTTSPLTAEIDGSEWHLGYVHQTCRAEHWTATNNAGSGVLTPGDDDRLYLALAPGTEQSNRAELGRVHASPITDGQDTA